MEEIYRETFKFAKIKILKNYSNSTKKVVIYDSDPPTPFEDIDDPFSAVSTSELNPAPMIKAKKHVVSADIRPNTQSSLENFTLYEKNPRNYFYTTNPTDSYVNHARRDKPVVNCEIIKLVNAKPRRKHDEWTPEWYETSREKHIKRHYYNPFAEIQVFTIDRWIKREGNVIKIKFFRQEKSRNVGVKYFRKVTSSVTVTFDMVKGNFLVVTYEGHKKKKTKRFFKNSFTSLERALPSILAVREYGISKASHLWDELQGSFDNEMFATKMMGVLGIESFRYEAKARHDEQAKTLVDRWMYKFIDLKKIKMPNDGMHLLKYMYPTEKYLKKNDRKLVAALLDRYGILSKFTIKLVHLNSSVDISAVYQLHQLFGENGNKYFGNLNPNFFTSNGSRSPFDPINFSIARIEEINPFMNFDIKDFEKKNMVAILNDATDMSQSKYSSPTNMINELIDHLRMMEKLRQFYPDLRLRVTKHKTFVDEHSRLAALEREIKKGYSTKRIFEKHIIEAIEKDIEIVHYDGKIKLGAFQELGAFIPNRKVYKPVLLKTSEEYAEEGAIMHHCVAGYIEHSRSIIVSLRCGDERVTCEFETSSKKCLQARYYQNQNPPEHFQKPLEILKDQIKRIPFSVGPRESVQVPLKINGVEVDIKKLRQGAEMELDLF
jgi:hypothetical protein